MLTIVIPYKDRADYLPRTLASLPEVPLVLVDNGSTDNSADICAQYAASHPHTLCLSCPTGGAAAARNAGLAAVRTEWVYFFDSDDLFEEGLVSFLKPHLTPELDMICLPTRQGSGQTFSTRAYRPTADPLHQVLVSHLCTLSMVFRTDWLRSIGGWDACIGVWDDWVLGLKALLYEPRLKWFTERAWHRIILHPESQTGACFSDRANGIFLALSKAEGHIREHGNNPRLLRAIQFRRAIVCGHLQREGHHLPHSERPTGLYARLLMLYTRLGFRAAWRIALALV